MDTPGYIPRDLPVVEFAAMLHVAVSEHVQHHRLVFRDTTNMTFGDGGTMRIHPIADDHAIVREGVRALLTLSDDIEARAGSPRSTCSRGGWSTSIGSVRSRGT